MSAFKAYDIRGRYGDTVTETLAQDVGRALADVLHAERVVVGRDMRLSSTPLADALAAGIRRQGATVIDLGIVSTPMTYFTNLRLEADASVMVTASHNPPEDNGFKINRAGAAPMGLHSGLADIRRLVESRAFSHGCCAGGIEHHDIKPAYWQTMRAHAAFSGRPRLVCDYANAVGSIEMDGIADLFDLTALYSDLDGSQPNHPANPLMTDTLGELRRTVVASGAAFGAAFDGDADRVGFVDERGDILRLDLVTALLAERFLADGPAPIVHDVRSGWAVRERIRELGGTPVLWRVGHAFAKAKIRQLGAPFGGELAGHYYYGELSASESTALTTILLANLLDSRGTGLAELAAPLRRYANSGELNVELSDPDRLRPVIEAIRDRYRGMRHEVDGLTVEYADWWFNLRASNTEPKLRLVVEAVDEDRLARHRDELLTFIRECL